MKLKEIFKELINSNLIYYYSEIHDMEYPQDEKSAKNFIEKYFVAGEKHQLVDKFSNQEIQRALHMVNVFFIGNYMQLEIDAELNIEDKERYPFSYLWFLACLAHDMGYIYEHKAINEKQILLPRQDVYKKLKINDISFLSTECNSKCYLKGESYKFKNCNNECQGEIIFNNGTTIDHMWYKDEIKESYFRYVLEIRNQIEHGISGADLLLSKLVENYHISWEKATVKNNICDFTYKNKIFRCEQFKIWQYIADCIACHNIFKIDENDAKYVKIYKDYNLQNLIGENFRKISYEENPILFILCVADTLEPYKRFGDNNVLEDIDISYNHNNNTITVKISERLKFHYKCKEYINGIKSLPDWVDVNAEIEYLNY